MTTTQMSTLHTAATHQCSLKKNHLHLLTCSVLMVSSLSLLAPKQANASDAPAQYSGINRVVFQGAEPQLHLGNGFIVNYEGKNYGVTAKHVLLMTQKAGLTSSDFQSRLQSWTLHPMKAPEQSVQFNKVLNGDQKEALNEGLLLRDALVFSLKGELNGFTALPLAKAPAKAGDRVHAIGCSYARAKECTQDQYSGIVVGQRGPNLMIDIGTQSLDQMFGLSGAPVLNERNEVVGIVSNVLPDADGKPRFAPVDIAYLKEVLQGHSSRSQ